MGAVIRPETVRAAAGTDSQWAYTLLTPDAVVGGMTGRILGRISSWGLTVGPCRLVQLRVRTMQRFYGGGDSFLIADPGSPNKAIPWTAHGQLYASAPACIILVRAPLGVDPFARMLRCKGPTRPELADGSTIRALGENVVFNLVHSPDDRESAVRELALLVGAEESAALIGTGGSLDEPRSAAVGHQALAAALPAFDGWSSTSFPMIANRVRRRVLQRAAVLVEDPEPVGRAVRLLDEESLLYRAEMDSRTRLAVALDRSAEIARAMRQATTTLGDGTVDGALDALEALADPDGARAPEAIWALADRAVFLTPLERAIVETHGNSFRRNAELDGIYW